MLLLFVGTLPCVASDTLTIANVESHFLVPTERGRGQIECHLWASYPVSGGSELQSSIKTWLTQTLCDIVSIDSVSVVPSNPLMSELESRFLAAAQSEALQVPSGYDKSFGLVLDAHLEREYETSRAITLNLEVKRYGVDSVYIPVNRSITFLKSGGDFLEWGDLLLPATKQQTRFRTALIKQILRYFNMSSYDDLCARLGIDPQPAQSDFPLPQLPPALTPNGLRVTYQVGELSPISGFIVTYIPYSDVKGTFTNAAKKLL